MIPYGRQSISEDDIAAVVAVLRSDWLTQGPAIERFEASVAARCGARFAVAVSNATAALHLACQALGLKPGGRLWTSPNTFVASANCGRYCGAEVDFVDIDPRCYNLDPAALAEKLAAADKQGRLPDVLVPVLDDWSRRCPKTQEDLVFPTRRRDGTWGLPRDASVLFGLPTLLAAAGCRVPAHPWHALRHTFASHFIMAGGNILALQKILGHTDVKITMVYAHLAPEFVADEMNRLRF